MTKNLIDATISQKPLEFYQAFADQMAERTAAIVANQKAFFAQNFLGDITEAKKAAKAVSAKGKDDLKGVDSGPGKSESRG